MAALIKISGAIFCVVLLFSSINSKPLTKKEREEIGNQCVKETGVDRAIIANVVKTQQTVDNEQYLDYLVCSYKLQGFLDKNGPVILHDNIVTFLSDFYTMDELTFVMKECKEVKNTDVRQLVGNTLECLLRKLKEVDVMRTTAKNQGKD
ncbi:uncharacterized protein [Atheta coriaria]|uniref:uncharacterized protein n=1 Tax=Dalotia coriaria TaxID=877792 RepID=UPI0031F3DA6C